MSCVEGYKDVVKNPRSYCSNSKNLKCQSFESFFEIQLAQKKMGGPSSISEWQPTRLLSHTNQELQRVHCDLCLFSVPQLSTFCQRNSLSVLDACKLSLGFVLGTFTGSKEVCMGVSDLDTSSCEVARVALDARCSLSHAHKSVTTYFLGKKDSTSSALQVLLDNAKSTGLFDVVLLISTKISGLDIYNALESDVSCLLEHPPSPTKKKKRDVIW